MFYDWFENPFSFHCGSPYLNIPFKPLEESFIPNKKSRYTPYQIISIIRVASRNSAITLTAPSESSQDIFLIYDAHSTDHTIMREKSDCYKEKK